MNRSRERWRAWRWRGATVLWLFVLVLVISLNAQRTWAAGSSPATLPSLDTATAVPDTPTPDNGTKRTGPLSPTAAPATATTVRPSPTVGESATPAQTGWEDDALRDLAEVLGWPTTVTINANDRRDVQRYNSHDDWALAQIRPFTFAAAAQAAFAAEEEDARLSGYEVNTDAFYSFPAYMATLTSASGEVIERRFHVLSASWILGADLHFQGADAATARMIAQELITLGAQYGLPVPASSLAPSPQSTAASSATVLPADCGISFSDVPPDFWAHDYIMQLACAQVVSGFGDGSFRPHNPTTRAQLVKMIVLSEGWSLVDPTHPTFSDVGRTHVFYRYVETALEHNLIVGYEDGTFHPDAYVTRAQVAKIIVLARGWPLQVTHPATLCDVPAGHWAYMYVQVAVERGLFSGYADGCFRPDAPATRAQLAKVILLSLPSTP